ncbi:hypothetical protein GC177_06470 [bacterium]|nr:hypothetical protein [bacterium]
MADLYPAWAHPVAEDDAREELNAQRMALTRRYQSDGLFHYIKTGEENCKDLLTHAGMILDRERASAKSLAEVFLQQNPGFFDEYPTSSILVFYPPSAGIIQALGTVEALKEAYPGRTIVPCPVALSPGREDIHHVTVHDVGEGESLRRILTDGAGLPYLLLTDGVVFHGKQMSQVIKQLPHYMTASQQGVIPILSGRLMEPALEKNEALTKLIDPDQAVWGGGVGGWLIRSVKSMTDGPKGPPPDVQLYFMGEYEPEIGTPYIDLGEVIRFMQHMELHRPEWFKEAMGVDSLEAVLRLSELDGPVCKTNLDALDRKYRQTIEYEMDLYSLDENPGFNPNLMIQRL